MRLWSSGVDVPHLPSGWGMSAWVSGVLVAAVMILTTAFGPSGSATPEAGPQLGPPAGEVETNAGGGWWEGPWDHDQSSSGQAFSVVERDARASFDAPSGAAGRQGMVSQQRRVDEGSPATPPDQPSPAEPMGTASGAEHTGGESADPGPGAGGEVSVRSVEGFDVAAGGAAAGEGATVRYTVEVEPAVGADLLAVTSTVEEALSDPRSWVVDHRLERVDDPARADVRVLLATPDTVDALCGQVGLRTRGLYSCWNGTFAALNAMRWHSGADGFDDLTTYRRYLVNHEFGHGLGHGHVDCPAPGAPAPVMMQQTMSTGACEPNGWPYPDAEGS